MPSALDTIDPAWAWQPFEPTAEQEWNRTLAAHLFRRASFGATAAQIDAAVKQSPASVVEQIVRGSADTSDFRRQCDELATTLLATGNSQQLAAWWVYVMLHTANPLLERMTLFWHGHFATSAEKVTDAASMLAQNRLLRRYALGDFRPLVQEISRDPAMLVYLDSATNRKAHPNENYARELMELFCLGEGNYSEQDVQELARCFTGWEIKSGQFRFNRFQHDSGSKSVLGKTGAFEEGESIDWILTQPQTALFIVGKLYRQFICDEPTPPPQLLEPLASELREHEWQIGPVVERILGSQLFFSARALGRKVRSPVDMAVGLLRSLDGTTDTHLLAADLEQNGQGLFYPPNVKGWDGGRAWINSSTILGRANMTARLVGNDKTRFGDGTLDEYIARLGTGGPEQAVDLLSNLLLAVPLPPPSRESLIGICRKNANQSRGVAEAVHALATLPEFQLA
ncbi:MAG TPA: DUF1800 domain-containing protein [Lacipirellulaceae bacterium]|jgi:uncharacterized protein (DUF1800 family)